MSWCHRFLHDLVICWHHDPLLVHIVDDLLLLSLIWRLYQTLILSFSPLLFQFDWYLRHIDAVLSELCQVFTPACVYDRQAFVAIVNLLICLALSKPVLQCQWAMTFTTLLTLSHLTFPLIRSCLSITSFADDSTTQSWYQAPNPAIFINDAGPTCVCGPVDHWWHLLLHNRSCLALKHTRLRRALSDYLGLVLW